MATSSLPRGAYEGETTGWQIGVNPLTTGRPLWFAIPDVIASTLLTGRPPKVLSAVRLAPKGQIDDLRPVQLRGEIEVDPAARDFFAAVIEERNSLPDRKGRNKRLSDFLKVLANATSYGIFAEMIRHELPSREKVDVTVHGLEAPYQWPVAAPEEPGKFAFPPIAALITSAARLMLALLERSVADAGGTYLMTDTDSMAVISTRDGGLEPCVGGRSAFPTDATRSTLCPGPLSTISASDSGRVSTRIGAASSTTSSRSRTRTSP